MQKISRIKFTYIGTIRAVGRSENSGLPILFGGHNLPPLIEIELKYLGLDSLTIDYAPDLFKRSAQLV